MIRTARILLLIFLAAGCVSLDHVNDLSQSALTAIKQYEEINFSFRQLCRDNCMDTRISSSQLTEEECDCQADQNADSVTQLIYESIKGYFDGLTRLSRGDLTSYKVDPVAKALKESDFGNVKVNKTHVDSYSKISTILLRATTDEYRKNKITQYIKEANDPIKNLLHYLSFNLSKNLLGKLNVRKQRLWIYYESLGNNATLSALEKRKVAQEYYDQMALIDQRKQELNAYAKGLAKISEAHQKITDKIDLIKTDELKSLAKQYKSDLDDIISEFNKLNQ